MYLPPRCSKPRAVLTSEQAVAIFLQRPNQKISQAGLSSEVARFYHVSDKTVRDIWRARTWYRETLHLDPARTPRHMRRPGRPLGSKDSSPRKTNTKMQLAASLVSRGGVCKPVPSYSDDPFHDDWPNWERADLCHIVDIADAFPSCSAPSRTQQEIFSWASQ